MAERRFLIQIDVLPADRDRQELLELVLAAATLDAPASILVTGEAVSLFDSGSDASWRQLIEQGLIDVLSDAADRQSLPSGVQPLDHCSREKLVQQSTVIRV
ncbi:MAG TPA: hypothetical protein VKO38_01865 [Wenzhouxiangella sp.]|nr:hypothetical protein [Wenzhouxiangella sp.]